ncbi:hypothetical protein McpSp1_13560 [Methanocorpusculaceae archaeon Sp1]|nr:hypothetical protein [Methanocorpusculaceae archaeon Sp1]
MKYGLLAAVVLLLAAVVLSAGCVGFPPAEDPLAGDLALGEWLGNRQTTQIDSETGEVLKISGNCRVKIYADGRGKMFCHYDGRGSSSFFYTLDGDVRVSKTDNVYTIDTSSAGAYVMTLSEDGYAKMRTPYGSEIFLQKVEA